MFENKNTLNQFLINLAECTKLGGYLIGTSYDGEKVFNLLKNKKQNESLIIKDDKDEETLLQITKLYDSIEFQDDITSLGYGINVYQQSINKTFKEYLVNYKYLTKILENFGFIPLSYDELKEINLTNSIGNFSDLYEIMQQEIKKDKKKANEYGSANNMSEELKRISFLNKYFIYKKVRNIDVNDIANVLDKKDENLEDEVTDLQETIQETQKELNQEKSLKTKGKTRKLKLITSK